MGHSSLHRLVQRHDVGLADAKQSVGEVSLDGGKVRLRSETVGQPSYWRDYKAARLDGIYYGAVFQNPLGLTDWINAQRVRIPLICLGDGHDGIWNLFDQIADPQQRQEILDWLAQRQQIFTQPFKKIQGLQQISPIEGCVIIYSHPLIISKRTCLKSAVRSNACGKQSLTYGTVRLIQPNNCFKIKAKSKPVTSVPILTNIGIVSSTMPIFNPNNFARVGSGAVESGVKQIDRRLKLSGAHWKPENVNQILA